MNKFLTIREVKKPYVITPDTTIGEALENLGLTGGQALVVVSQSSCVLEGVLSNGDINRYLKSFQDGVVDLSVKVGELLNANPVVAHDTDSSETLTQYFKFPEINVLPIVDHRRVLLKVAHFGEASVAIGDRVVSFGGSPFLLAEIGVNHQGSLSIARELIDASHKAGVDGIKFQHRSSGLYSDDSVDSFDLGTQYILSEIKRTHLSVDALNELCHYSKSLGLKVVVTPFDLNALEELKDMDIDAYKIASCDLNNFELLDAVGKTGMAVIVSTGMSYEHQIINASNFLKSKLVNHIFLHCNSTYPAPAEDINLSYIDRMVELTQVPVGYSSHDSDICVPLASISRGAALVEFHVTRSKQEKGTDHRASIELNQLGEFVSCARIISNAVGSASPRIPSQGELANKMSLGKSWGACKPLPKGTFIAREHLRLMSPGSGYGYEQLSEILGRELILDVDENVLIQIEHFSNIDDSVLIASTCDELFDFGYRAGIPVRYHDFDRLRTRFDLGMYEFHMSDRDLSLDASEFIKSKSDAYLIVHAVEQFEDGFIFDLASTDQKIVDRSLLEFDRLAKSVKALAGYFQPVEKTPLVLNAGGFTTEGFMSYEESKKATLLLAERLNVLSMKYQNLEILPQTMPPFPWHQGGKSYHNILTSIESSLLFLEYYEGSICFDVSHSALSAEYFGEDLYEFAEETNDRVKHIHLSDASGLNAEGLSVGEGAINMAKLHGSLGLGEGRKQFMIPEIWQGHLKNGEGFANSLIRFLEILKKSDLY